MKKINITASNLDEFKEIEDLLKTLPEIVSSHILSAKNGGVGLECIIEDYYESDQKIFIPNNVTQISHFDGYIGIYCGDFFFKLTEKMIDKKLTYVFVDLKKSA